MASYTARGYAILLGAAVGAALTVSGASAQSIVDKAARDEVAAVAEDDPLMASAMSKARQTLPTFLDAASHPKPGTDNFGVKVAIREGDRVEYFWVAPFRRNGESFSGELDNEPRTVRGVVLGQTITFRRSQIIDWTYTDGKRMIGNDTARVLLQRASPAERAEFKQRYGLDSDF
jgi:uncharacterized protein YegJ (DUF2314 family)